MNEFSLSRRGLLITGAAAALLGGQNTGLWLLDLNALAGGENLRAVRTIERGTVINPARFAPFPDRRWHALLAPANLFVLQECFRFERGWSLRLLPQQHGEYATLVAVEKA